MTYSQNLSSVIEALVEQIESVLQKEKQCLVGSDDLRRVWPYIADQDRERIVCDFAKEHGWRILTYNRVVGAILVRE